MKTMAAGGRPLRAGLVLLALAAAAPVPAREPSRETLQRAIDAVIDRPAFAAALWGVEVRSLGSGRTVYARDAGKNLKPASTFKLLTTAAALDAFSPDERIRTSLESAGRLDAAGRLLGDLYLVGRGDANLSGRFSEGRVTAAFEELAEALMAAGVRRVEGRLVGHEGLFRGDRRGADWSWDDLVWWYGAEVSALSFNDNSADLTLSAGEREGDPLLVERVPVSSYYEVVSTAVTAAAGGKSDLTLERDLGSNRIRISGSHPLGEKPWQGSVALEDPARYATTVLREVLEQKGVRVTGPVATSSDPLPEGLRVLAGHDSPPLAEILKAINKPSQNLHTEILLRLLGARVKGEGSLDAGHEALRQFFEKVGVAPEPGALRDASGLSRSDLLRPHELVALLAAMDRHPHARVFRDSLPVAGVDGSLKNRMKGTPAEGRIVAKTGSIRNVNALAGYATRRDGERLAFAILVNHYTGPAGDVVAAIDEIAQLLVR